MTTPDDHPIDYRQEHRGEVVVRDATALTSEQLIRAQAATIARAYLGEARSTNPAQAGAELLAAARPLAEWIRDGGPTDPAGSAS